MTKYVDPKDVKWELLIGLAFCPMGSPDAFYKVINVHNGTIFYSVNGKDPSDFRIKYISVPISLPKEYFLRLMDKQFYEHHQ